MEVSDSDVGKTVQSALSYIGMNYAKMFVTKLVKEENVVALKNKKITLQDLEVHVS